MSLPVQRNSCPFQSRKGPMSSTCHQVGNWFLWGMLKQVSSAFVSVCWPVEPLAALIAKSALVRMGPMLLGPYATSIPATCLLCSRAHSANARVDYTQTSWYQLAVSSIFHIITPPSLKLLLPPIPPSFSSSQSHSLPLPRLSSLFQLSPIFPFLIYKGVCLLGDIRG